MTPESLLASTQRWISALPVDVQPAAILNTLPHIANELAEHWESAQALRSYVNELLIDERGKRALPIRIPRELYALRAYHASLHHERDNGRKSEIAVGRA